MYNQSSTPAGGRTREEIQAFMAGTDILEPGVVWTTQWRPEFNARAESGSAWLYAAIGRKKVHMRRWQSSELSSQNVG